ncbi:MAG: hypothetical protein AAFO85_05320 [Cyanobacteria bacterium J06598_4]
MLIAVSLFDNWQFFFGLIIGFAYIEKIEVKEKIVANYSSENL